jgi:hypothetical protein
MAWTHYNAAAADCRQSFANLPAFHSEDRRSRADRKNPL